jgi:L,D-transpeptidase YcbB
MKWRNFLPCGLCAAGAAALGLIPSAGIAASPQPTIEAGKYGHRDGVDLIMADLRNDLGLKPAALYRHATAGSGPVQSSTSALYEDLSDGLETYRSSWGALPQTHVPLGPQMRVGQRGPRVALLRQRLGLEEGDAFDAELAEAVRDYRRAHGLGDSPVADASTIASLNRGAAHYEQLILLNLERLSALPVPQEGRYILVDAAAARLWLYEDGRPRDSMKVVVGKIDSPTPMLATTIRWAELNPYWNVPPDLVRKLIAPRVLKDGISYLAEQQYEVLSDWSSDPEVVDPETVDWSAVVAGRTELRVRQRPGATNAMGDIKFMMRNDFGIYLHDTPNKELFAAADRWKSNGCVRVEDARRLARWISRDIVATQPKGPGEILALEDPVPVYITYLTAATDQSGRVVFRDDPYDRDRVALASMFGPKRIQTASRS